MTAKSAVAFLSLDGASNLGWSRWLGQWGKQEDRAVGFIGRVPAPRGPFVHYTERVGKYSACLRTVFDRGLARSERNACDEGSDDRWTASTTRRSAVPTSCSDWFGPNVIAAACDPREADHDPAKATLFLSATGAASDAAAGVAQLVADEPLGPGDKLTIRGTAAATTQIAVRIETSGGGSNELLFQAIGLQKGGTATVLVTAPVVAGGPPRVTLQTPAGKKLKPAQTLARIAPVKSLRIVRAGKKTTVSFRASSARARIELRNAAGKLLARRVLATKAGRIGAATFLTAKPPVLVSVTPVDGTRQGPSATWTTSKKRG